jgi:L-serine dehydratase
MARELLGEELASATFTFDPHGSYAQVYRHQGSDLAFATGILGYPITDEAFPRMLDIAASRGVGISFAVEPLTRADHPNTAEIELVSTLGRRLRAMAKSVGGGAFVFTELDGWPVRLTGNAHEVLVVATKEAADAARESVTGAGQLLAEPVSCTKGDRILLHARRIAPLGTGAQAALESLPGVDQVWTAPAVFFVQQGQPCFSSCADMVAWAERRCRTLSQAALAYESALLGLSESQVLAKVHRRLDLMRDAVHLGLSDSSPPMQLLPASAPTVMQREARGQVAIGGLHTRAAARAMAVMHVNAGKGVVCAAPTAGSAGTIPGVIVTLMEDKGLSREQAACALLASSAIGLVVAQRATFAAEIAGCQVEIGAAGAMAAAAVVEAAGGTPQQAADAAAIAFQNTMGLICDLVQGVVEIPCHTRNAVAASSAFVVADLVLGGYANPIPLDETIDAVYDVGRMLPRELKCTALGGLALAPAARSMARVATMTT